MIKRIDKEIKESLKNKNNERKVTFRSIKAKALSLSKENHTDVSDQIVVKAIKKEIKELEQTRESYLKIKDPSLEQLSYLSYLNSIIEELKENWIPKVNREELKDRIKAILIKSPAGMSFGLKMKVVMKELNNEFDGKIVSEIIRELG